MLRFILITNDPLLATECEAAGIDRIMVDLESIGKAERQKSRSTFISRHQPSDIAPMAAALKKAQLMVRINPWHDGSRAEITHAIKNGAQRIMLPMITDIAQVSQCLSALDGKVPLLPLIETRFSMEHLEEMASLDAIDSLYFGLNDLHLSLGMRFLFEPLAEGHIDRMAAIAKKYHKPFGFGGIAALSGEAELPARLILAEHVRLGSGSVILSSRFAKDIRLEEREGRKERLVEAVGLLRTCYGELKQTTHEALESSHRDTAAIIHTIAARLRRLDS